MTKEHDEAVANVRTPEQATASQDAPTVISAYQGHMQDNTLVPAALAQCIEIEDSRRCIPDRAAP